MEEITVRFNGSLLTYTPAPGTDLSKLDIVEKEEKSLPTMATVGNTVIEYETQPLKQDVEATPRFKGGDDMKWVDPKKRDPFDVAITSDEPSEGIHSLNEGFWYDDDGQIMPDDELYRFNTEYVQLCKRKFDCYVPNYTNKSGLVARTLIVDVSKSSGPFDNSHGKVTDNSTAMELNKISVIDIAKYMYDGVPVTTRLRDDAFHILNIVNDALDKYIGAIPVAPTTFIAPEEWFEPLTYLRESILEARPGLIKKLVTNFDHAGKPRRPRIARLKRC